ncbi:hypothetical protein KY309_02950 [Candidatus Woesearchaeota archaeon]|nr:hypothetical protein [Candidatus Woesearchaeota archaeon]MBW3016544.1 hypothetical protein [Candidatus Woesearchaeota archaeon]
MAINQMLEDTGWGAIGSSPPTASDAEETLKLTDEEIFGIYQRYEKMLDEMLNTPEFYKLLKNTKAL